MNKSGKVDLILFMSMHFGHTVTFFGTKFNFSKVSEVIKMISFGHVI